MALDLRDEYFEYLCDLVGGVVYSQEVSFRKLLIQLHDTEFIAVIPRDANRADDGASLRFRFALDHGFVDAPELDGPCSIFEMMVALAIRCEETIMDNPAYGNRTGQWFWGMVRNLGLGSMLDNAYDSEAVEEILYKFLYREYEPDGRGGLFTVRRCPYDLRNLEIWVQLNWYLNSIT